MAIQKDFFKAFWYGNFGDEKKIFSTKKTRWSNDDLELRTGSPAGDRGLNNK
jgi:hypothetical protein